jgi:hypothetical protein
VGAAGASARAGKVASIDDANAINATVQDSVFLVVTILMGAVRFDVVVVMASDCGIPYQHSTCGRGFVPCGGPRSLPR